MSEATNVYDLLSHSYDDWMTNLKAAIEVYESHQIDKRGKTRIGMSVFCEDVGISRPNLGNIFNPETDQEMSIYYFYTITKALGCWPEGVGYSPTVSHHRISLRHALSIPFQAIIIAGSKLETL